MRALTKLLFPIVILSMPLACGDALELGGSGEQNPGSGGSGARANLDPCLTTAGSSPECAACNQIGESCGASDNVTCCCDATTAGAAYTCFANGDCCPASAPQVGEPCTCTDAACQYCSANGAFRLVCGSDGTWVMQSATNSCIDPQ
jgi:hypothetical protein